ADEVVLLDNGSTDDSREFVQQRFPTVTWFPVSANRFLVSYNEYLAQSKHPLVFLLNNDVSLRPGCLPPLLRHFDDPRVFAVAPLVLNPGDHVENGRTCLTWSQGRFGYRQVDAHPGFTASASTAAGMFDREKLVSFGGFDDLLLPMYGEEMDLALSAYRRGWVIRFEPRAVADHIGGASINKTVTRGQRRKHLVKNRHLSIVKHIHSWWLLAAYVLWTMLLLPVRLLTFDGEYFAGTWASLKQLRYALDRRRREQQSAVLTDGAVLRKLVNLRTPLLDEVSCR
ncbi:MAG: glycosyltransferase, partial [Verrucomicrobia bacterium]|nr:glycosyltransferase [Verrucomicrobiota bacterium]